MPTRIEVNVGTGERTEVEVTQAEIDAAVAATAAEASTVLAPQPTIAEIVAALPQASKDVLAANAAAKIAKA